MPKPSIASGYHLLLEVHAGDAAVLDDPTGLADRLSREAQGDPTVLPATGFHYFQPQGVSGALWAGDVLLTVHTWPEQGFAAIDLFSRSPLDAEAWHTALVAALTHP
jgi:S-adenosylmethionine/arginine decarboxylase-like enzyme